MIYSAGDPGYRTEKDGKRLFFAVALPSFILYLSTLAPTVTPEDSGELITAAYTLGIAHPPGYPLWCLLGKLFTLIPVGSVAWRVNLLSATLGACAAGVLALLAYRFTKTFYASLIAALIYAVTRDFWSQAVIAEVYTLNVLLFLLLLLFVLWFEDTQRTRWLYLASSVLGISLTNHSTILPLAPVFVGWVFLRHPGLFRNRILLLNLLGAFLVGFSIILYLPIRSLVDPVLDWGNPETLSGALDHFLRRQYTGAEVPRPRTIGGQATLVLHFFDTFTAQFTPLLAALSLPGAWILWKRERATSILLLSLFAITSYGFIWLLNYTPDRENLHLTRVFFLPAFAVGTLWIAVFLEALSRWVSERSREPGWSSRLALPALGVICVLLPFAAHLPLNDQSRAYLAEDWGRNILLSLKPRAIIAPSADHSTFPLVYLQVVEGVRPDVLIADKYGYIDDASLESLFKGEDTPRVPPPLGRRPAEAERFLIEESGRPVYFTTKSRLAGLDTHEIRTWGLVFEVKKKDAKEDEKEHEALWETFRFHAGELTREPGDFSQDLILSDYHYARARFELLLRREEEAMAAVLCAERYGFGLKEIHNNLGGTLAEAGKVELAIPFFKRALGVDPEYDMALKNMANACFTSKRYLEGFPFFDKVLVLQPQNPIARLGKARAHRALGEAAEAYFAYLRVWREDPRNDALRDEIKEFVLKEFGKESTLANLPLPEVKIPRADPFDEDPREHKGIHAGPAGAWGGISENRALPYDPHDALGP